MVEQQSDDVAKEVFMVSQKEVLALQGKFSSGGVQIGKCAETDKKHHP